MSSGARVKFTLATIAWIVCTGRMLAGELPAPEAPASEETAWLGVFVGDAIDGGVQLVAVVAGGPAQKAGLRAGDLLVRLDGSPVPDRDAVNVLTRRIRPGSRVAAEILRDGRRETRWLEPAPRVGPAWRQMVPAPVAPGASGELSAVLDATLVAIPEALRLHYGAPADRGALVVGVGPGGAGGAGGLRVGDVITAVDGAPVGDPLACKGVSAGAAHRIEIVRAGERSELALPLRSDPARDPQQRVLQAEIERLTAKVQELERELALERSRRVR